MTLVCAHCKSQSVVYDREFVAGTGWIDRPRCMMCGREKFEEKDHSTPGIKELKNYEIVKFGQPEKPANNITENYSSPMQVGETLKGKEGTVNPRVKCNCGSTELVSMKTRQCAVCFERMYGISYADYLQYRTSPQESPVGTSLRVRGMRAAKPEVPENKVEEEKPMITPTLKCSKDGCDNPIAASKLCDEHFLEKYGIAVADYRADKRFKTESPAIVAKRLKGGGAQEEKAQEEKQEPYNKPPFRTEEKAAAPANDVEKQETPIPLFRIFLDPELLDALTKRAKAEYRTPEMQAAYMLHQVLAS